MAQPEPHLEPCVNVRAVIEQAVKELDAEHRPEWSSDEMKARGKDPIGCAMCWPKDGSWPCGSRMIADDLRRVLTVTNVPERSAE